ncbi:hypothetical protein MGSAQ_002371, partial [marine sediment metagenome]
ITASTLSAARRISGPSGMLLF